VTVLHSYLLFLVFFYSVETGGLSQATVVSLFCDVLTLK